MSVCVCVCIVRRGESVLCTRRELRDCAEFCIYFGLYRERGDLL